MLLVETLNSASQSVGQIQNQVVEISHSVSQQAQVADEISQTVAKVKYLSDDAVNCGNELEHGFESMSASATELSNSLNRFKV